MKKLFGILLACTLMLAGCPQRHNSANSPDQSATTNTKAENRPEAVDRLNDSAKVLNELMGTPESSIPDTVIANARCVMVVPSMIKGGFVFGGEHGRGVATCRNQNGRWSAPAFTTLTGGTWGAQIGGESVDLVLVFMNDKGAEDLLKSKIKLGA